jgi:serine phosphatase RsbU (regulator of sigma subunit)/pSer/pThr/pTyr-binding forkhead associated (FHA) protein
MDVLEWIDGQGLKGRKELNRPHLLLGRAAHCDVHLPHAGVSRLHAQIQRTDQGQWLLQDLKSRNKVYLDGKSVQQFILEPNKPFQIADYWLTLLEAPTQQETEQVEVVKEPLTPMPEQEPGWLEQMQKFQRGLFQIDKPDLVLQHLAREFARVQPKMLAVGLARPDGYTWEIQNDLVPTRQGDLDEATHRAIEENTTVQSWKPEGHESLASLLFPMKGRFGIVGHVYIQWPGPGPMPTSLKRYLSVLSSVSALLYENLQLASLRLAQREMEHELQQARQIQMGLFPSSFEMDDRLDVFALNLPSAKVSGDYYDLVRTGPHTLAFVIADAMGHGMPAALLMASVRAVLRLGLTLGLPWEALFQGLDEVIQQARAESYVTGLIGKLDLEKHTLEIVSAGHPMPSVLIGGRQVSMPSECRTRAWGVVDIPHDWEIKPLSLGDGPWSVLCYTDGVSDAWGGPTQGSKRVAECHGKHHPLRAEELCQNLLSEVAGPGEFLTLADDQTVLALQSTKNLP